MRWPLTLLSALANRRLRLRSGRDLPPLSSWEHRLLFVLLGRLAKSNGRVLPMHIDQARAEILRLGLAQQAQQQAIEAFTHGKNSSHSLRWQLLRQRRQADALLHACWRMAWSDGQISPAERVLLEHWARWLGYDRKRLHTLEEAYMPGRPCSAAANEIHYCEALRLLDVNERSDPQQIKRAYRRLLSQHHPDKLAGQGADEARLLAATERTRLLHQAYERIRQRRGFR